MAKTVLVTGGTLRLGRVIADHLRRVGWRVITTSHRADAGADVVADFSDPMGAVRAYAATLRLLDGQPPDALVNNAALFTGDEATLNAVNFEAPKKLTMLMAGRETGVGSVVNILDSRILRWGQTPSENWGQAPYEKTKLALLSEMRRQAAMFAETLLGRPAPEDVAEAVAYLLTAKSTTGAILPVDGGHALLGWGQTPLD